MEQQIGLQIAVGAHVIARTYGRPLFSRVWASRWIVLAMAAASVVVSSEPGVEAGGRRGGGGGMPRPQPQWHPPAWQAPWVPEPVPAHETAPPRRHPTQPRPKNSPSVLNHQGPNPDRVRPASSHPSSHPRIPLKLDDMPQQVKSHSPSEHHLFMRRVHRHVVPWVVGVYPNNPYSLGWYVEQVLSGNTIRVRSPANVSQIMQLGGVAAPVKGQAFFDESRDRLASEIENQSVYVVNTFDHLDGSFSGKVFLGSEYVNRTQILEGMACYDAEQGIDTDLGEAEMAAQEAGRGIWGNTDFVSEYAYSE